MKKTTTHFVNCYYILSSRQNHIARKLFFWHRSVLTISPHLFLFGIYGLSTESVHGFPSFTETPSQVSLRCLIVLGF
jgi:hypothetical protein